jgi:hypothetical protein
MPPRHRRFELQPLGNLQARHPSGFPTDLASSDGDTVNSEVFNRKIILLSPLDQDFGCCVVLATATAS